MFPAAMVWHPRSAYCTVFGILPSLTHDAVMRLHATLLHQRDNYLPDTDTFVYIEPRTGRNKPCPCGSGKKFKKCYGSGPMIH